MAKRKEIIFCPHDRLVPIYGTRQLQNPYKGTLNHLAQFSRYRDCVLGVKCLSCNVEIKASSLVHTGYPYYWNKPNHSIIAEFSAKRRMKNDRS